MAEDFQLGSGNWWESSTTTSSRLRSSSSSSSAAVITSTALHQNDVNMGSSFGCWPTNLVVDTKPKSSLDSVSDTGDDGSLLSDHHASFPGMGLGLSSRPIPSWNNNPSLLSNVNFHQQDSSYDYDKQMNRLTLDQPAPPQFLGGAASCQGSTTTSSDLDSALGTSASTMLQAGSSPMDFSYDISSNYGMKAGGDDVMSSSWSKFPQFLRTKQPQQLPPPQLQFSNNTAFWNAMNDSQLSFFPAVDEKPKNTPEARDSSTVANKSSSTAETSSKRPRDQNETQTPMPAFKVRKEKMGDRITALQQLISPFGKTDTASVLSETIEYIKFLHDQVNVLSTPYMKSGVSMRHQQNLERSKSPETGSKQDLKSRGLCLVPISNTTFPLTPTFGGGGCNFR